MRPLFNARFRRRLLRSPSILVNIIHGGGLFSSSLTVLVLDWGTIEGKIGERFLVGVHVLLRLTPNWALRCWSNSFFSRLTASDSFSMSTIKWLWIKDVHFLFVFIRTLDNYHWLYKYHFRSEHVVWKIKYPVKFKEEVVLLIRNVDKTNLIFYKMHPWSK